MLCKAKPIKETSQTSKNSSMKLDKCNLPFLVTTVVVQPVDYNKSKHQKAKPSKSNRNDSVIEISDKCCPTLPGVVFAYLLIISLLLEHNVQYRFLLNITIVKQTPDGVKCLPTIF